MSTFSIEFDYRFDTDGFFDEPARRATLEAAAAVWETFIRDEFTNVPAGSAIGVLNPQTGGVQTVTLDTEIDDLLVFVGAQSPPFGQAGAAPGSGGCCCWHCLSVRSPLGATTGVDLSQRGILGAAENPISAIARGGPSAREIAGTTYNNRFEGNNFEPWLGSISFDPTPVFADGSAAEWFFDPTPETTADVPSDRYDFLSIALHELGHVLGIGTASAFFDIGSGSSFDGINAIANNNGEPIPLQPDLGHVAGGFTSDDRLALMSVETTLGRREITAADLALLADIGYEIDGFVPQGATPPLTTSEDDIFFGTTAGDRISGLAGNDLLTGDLGSDLLDGGAGDDELQGGDGDDLLGGGSGRDRLFGNSGRDTYVFGFDSGEVTLSDFEFDREVIVISAEFGLPDADAVLDTLSKPFDNVSRLTLAPGQAIDIFHESQPGTPLTASNIEVASSDLALANPNPDRLLHPEEFSRFSLPPDTFSTSRGDLLPPQANSLPDWLNFQSETATFRGTPGTEDLGRVEIDVRSRDLLGNNASDRFSLTVTPFDLDRNDRIESNTDGTLWWRYLFGFRDSDLVADAIAPDATRTEPGAISNSLDGVVAQIDVDGNQRTDALTDGLLVSRYLAGFRGSELVADAIAPDATRTDPEAIAAFLDPLLPL